MLTLFNDAQAKLRGDFRGFGANLIVTANPGAALPPKSLQTVDSKLQGTEVAAPFAYAIAKVNGQAVVVGGFDVARMRRLDPFWLVSKWPSHGEALLGVRAAKQIASGALDLEFRGRALHVVQAGTLRTGSSEDSRIYIPLDDFIAWTGLQADTIEIAAQRRPNETRSPSRCS